MDYSEYKNFDEVINIIPEFINTRIINNWVKYITPPKNMENLFINYEKLLIEYDGNNIISTSKFFPEYVIKSLYDFKIFITINRREKNLIYFGWCPDINLQDSKLAYIVAGKVYNNTIHIYRIAQNPYYDNILNLKSIDLVKRLEDIEYNNGDKFIFKYDNLHEYDNRYNLSWNFYKNII